MEPLISLEIILTVNSDVTLYAQWTANPGTFSVTYNPNGGTGGTTDGGITAGTQYTVKSDTQTGVTRTGYTFAGWNTEAGGGGTAYPAGDDINCLTAMLLHNMHNGQQIRELLA